jgi:hypothetical protein
LSNKNKTKLVEIDGVVIEKAPAAEYFEEREEIMALLKLVVQGIIIFALFGTIGYVLFEQALTVVSLPANILLFLKFGFLGLIVVCQLALLGFMIYLGVELRKLRKRFF